MMLTEALGEQKVAVLVAGLLLVQDGLELKTSLK